MKLVLMSLTTRKASVRETRRSAYKHGGALSDNGNTFLLFSFLRCRLLVVKVSTLTDFCSDEFTVVMVWAFKRTSFRHLCVIALFNQGDLVCVQFLLRINPVAHPARSGGTQNTRFTL